MKQSQRTPVVGSTFSGRCDAFALAAEWVGLPTIWQVEKNEKHHRVLEKLFPNASRYFDIRDVGSHNLQPVDILVGGDPCQPNSVAGRREGEKDDRFLWPEKLRLVKELLPSWVINENVSGSISNLVLARKAADLEAEGYEVQAFEIPAVAVGALHVRKRVWLVAYSERNHRRRSARLASGQDTPPLWCQNPANISRPSQDAGFMANTYPEQRERFFCDNQEGRECCSNPQFAERCADVAHAGSERLIQQYVAAFADFQRQHPGHPASGWDYWATEPQVGRVADGVPNRIPDLEGLGNAIVPQVPLRIFLGIKMVHAA